MIVGNTSKIAFTLIELVVIITILSILSAIGFNSIREDPSEKYLNSFQDWVQQRSKELFQKALVSYNWNYSNNWVTKASYIELNCNNNLWKIEAFICDDTNSKVPLHNNCIQIDFPNFTSHRHWTFLSRKSTWYSLECISLRDNNSVWEVDDYYIQISTKFPYWEIKAFKDDVNNTPGIRTDDIRIHMWKVRVKKGDQLREFYPIVLK